MTNINLDIAKKLDGTETHMIAILVDSWGDKLVIDLAADRGMGFPDTIIAADYFRPCAHCGNAVLDCNFEANSDCCDRCTNGHKSGFVPSTNLRFAMLDMALTQTLPEDVMERHTPMTTVESNNRVVVNQSLDMDERIAIAVEAASQAFWDVIAKSFPDAVDGSFLMSDMDDIMKSWVDHWVDNNVPKKQDKPCNRSESNEKPESWVDELHLHYPEIWHNHQTGGGCMVVTSDNVVVAGEHRYLGITSECVVVYTDTFQDDGFLNVWEEENTWSFGDNPTVLMNIIDNAFGGNALWNTGHLFDDIVTIAKSGNC